MSIAQDSPPVDNLAAPVPRDEMLPATPYVAPRNDVERDLAEIWRQVFDLDRVGVEDDFFGLGGDSVHAVVIMSEIDRVFDRLYPSSALLENPTIESLAQLVTQVDVDAASSILFPFRTGGSKSPLFIVHGRVGHAFLNPVFTDNLDPERPVYCFQARGRDGRAAPHGSVEAMAEDYIGAMRAMQPHGPYALGSLCAGSHVAVAMAGILRRQGEDLHPLVLIDPPVVPPAREGRVDRSLSVARVRRILRRMSADGVFVGKNGRGYFRRIYRHFAYRNTMPWAIAEARMGGSQGDVASRSWDGVGRRRNEASGPDGQADFDAADRTAYMFMKALKAHEPKPIDGEIDAILSKDRAIWGADPNYYLRFLVKDLRVHVVGRDHKNLFREHLPDVAKTINEALRDAS